MQSLRKVIKLTGKDFLVMNANIPLTTQQLLKSCDPKQFKFQTTAELEDLSEIVGQMRAMEAVQFGAGIQRDGYNIFVLGPVGVGKRSMVRRLIEKKAASEKNPHDWCYINNFDQPHKPLVLKLPAGGGEKLRIAMEQQLNYWRSAIPALFDSEEYHARTKAVGNEFNQRQERTLKELGDEAEKQETVLLRTPDGFAFAPTRNHEVIPPAEYENLSEEDKKRIEGVIAKLQEHLEKILIQLPQWRKEQHEKVKQIDREIALSAIMHSMRELELCYENMPEVLKYLDRVKKDVIDHVDDFRKQEEFTTIEDMSIVTRQSFHQYQVNVLVSHVSGFGAPIISEDNPTYSNLVGRVEHVSQFGALVTEFTLIKPGALHLANGGYLLLDVRKVLMQPFAWEGLKRALQSHEICIESLGQMYSLFSTMSLEPEPIPLDTKVIVFGDRLFYYLLQEYDPEFEELFKVAADFEDHVERNDEMHFIYARLISTLVRKESLLHLDCAAVARVIDYSSRLVGDSERLSAHMHSIADLLRETDYWAREANHSIAEASDVQRSIDAKIRRQERLKDQIYKAVLRDTLMIDTEGAVVGQINGLSVIELGHFTFAQPIRITATSRLGDGELINIEREVKLSGAIHSKGVLILSAFLAERYTKDQPLSFSASLVFEQSYGLVDGDSASLAELCALLSNIANIPIKQSLAITGSVNQFGQSQVIGAVNEKIEGFFDICLARGLTGEQGVLIPTANIKHLMLRQEIISAVEAGKFKIYAVEHADQALTILTGLPAGFADTEGNYPEGSINYRVKSRLAKLAKIKQAFAKQTKEKSDKEEAH